jgi:sugar/nucleoside kinase (ribokinase family)
LGLSISVDLDVAYQGLEASKTVIRQADIVLVNRQGAERCYPGKDIRYAAQEIGCMGPSLVVVTTGKQGAVLWWIKYLSDPDF